MFRSKQKLVPSRNYLFSKILSPKSSRTLFSRYYNVKIIRIWEVLIFWHGTGFTASEEKEVLTSFHCLEPHQYLNRNIRERLVGIWKDSVACGFINVSRFTLIWVRSIPYLETAMIYASSHSDYCLHPHLGLLGHLPTSPTLRYKVPLTVLEVFHSKGGWMGCLHLLTLTRAADGCGPFKCTTESWTR